MDKCEKFLEGFKQNNLSDWKLELASTFSNFRIEKTYGFNFDYGDFEKCINFKSNEIQGKECWVQYYSTLSDTLPSVPNDIILKDMFKDMNTRLVGSVCIPSICDANKVVPKLMEIVLNGTKYVMASDYNQDDFCRIKKNFKLNASVIFGMSIIFSILALVLFSTIKSFRSKSKILSSFNFIRNFKNLFTDENRDESVNYIRGIKGPLFFILPAVHAFICATYIPSNNPEKVTKFYSKHVEFFLFLTMPGPTVFLVVGTFLTTRNLWKLLDKKGSFNIWMVCAYRYLRITPTLFFHLIVEKFIMENWVSTIFQRPHFFPNVYFRNFKYYWLHLLHIQNFFVDIRETPFIGWYYFAVDFQLFVLTIVVVYLIWKWRPLRFIIFPAFLIIGLYINYSYLKQNSEYFRTVKYVAYEEKIMSKYIQETQFGLISWVFGIWAGYFSVNSSVNFKKIAEVITWSVIVILPPLDYLKVKLNAYEDNRSFFNSIDKLSESFWTALMIILLHFGSRNLIYRIFSHKFWIPIDRLGFCYFAVQMHVFIWLTYWQQDYFQFDLISIFHFAFTAIWISILYAFFVNLMIEQPVNNMLKLLLKDLKTKKD